MFKAFLIVGAVLSLASAAQADDFVRADCRSTAGSANLKFETPDHALWYKRFWTGDCDRLKHCFSGSPNWNEIVGKLMARATPGQKAALLPKTCRLGQLIGMEWGRDKRIKFIQTADLRGFTKIMDSSPDAMRGVEQVEQKARAMIAAGTH